MRPAFVLLAMLGIAALRQVAHSAWNSAPAASSFTLRLEAARANPALNLDHSAATASFGANVRGSCMPNPDIAGSVCPDLVVRIRGNDGRVCSI